MIMKLAKGREKEDLSKCYYQNPGQPKVRGVFNFDEEERKLFFTKNISDNPNEFIEGETIEVIFLPEEI